MGKLTRFRRGLIGTGSTLVLVFFEQLIYIESVDSLDIFLQMTIYVMQAFSTMVPKVAVRMHFSLYHSFCPLIPDLTHRDIITQERNL